MMCNARKNNKELFLFNQSSASAYQCICAPITKNLPIAVDYLRIFYDASYSYLSDQNEWLKYFLDNIASLKETVLEAELRKTPEHGIHYLLWPEPDKDPLLCANLAHGRAHGFDVYIRQSDYIEIFSFCTDKDSHQMRSFYIDNLSLFKTFIESAQSSIGELISKLPHSSREVFSGGVDLKAHPPIFKKDAIDALTVELAVKDYFAKYTEKPTYFAPLSKQELTCLKEMSLCKTAKQAAATMGISHRTVESHLQHVREKTNGVPWSYLAAALRPT